MKRKARISLNESRKKFRKCHKILVNEVWQKFCETSKNIMRTILKNVNDEVKDKLRKSDQKGKQSIRQNLEKLHEHDQKNSKQLVKN